MDIVDQWQEECRLAREDIIDDANHEDIIDLLRTVANFDLMERDVVSVREELFIQLRANGAL